MLSWALTFLVIALIAGVLGFGVIAGTAATIAKICFFVFLVLFIVGLVMGRRGPITTRLQDLYFKSVRGELPAHTNWLAPVAK